MPECDPTDGTWMAEQVTFHPPRHPPRQQFALISPAHAQVRRLYFRADTRSTPPTQPHLTAVVVAVSPPCALQTDSKSQKVFCADENGHLIPDTKMSEKARLSLSAHRTRQPAVAR